MSDATVETVAPEGRGGRIARIAVAIIFGLFFAYIFFGALSNLIGLPAAIADTDLEVPWWLLILGLAVPLLVYLAAILLSRRRVLFSQVLIFVVALASCYALTLSINTLAPLLLLAQR